MLFGLCYATYETVKGFTKQAALAAGKSEETAEMVGITAGSAPMLFVTAALIDPVGYAATVAKIALDMKVFADKYGYDPKNPPKGKDGGPKP